MEIIVKLQWRRVMRKPFCVYENKGTDQLRGDRAVEQRLCFRYLQDLNFLNPKFQASSNLHWLYSPVCVRPGKKPRIHGLVKVLLGQKSRKQAVNSITVTCIHVYWLIIS